MAHILSLTIPQWGLDPAPIESKLDDAKDWIRYAPGCWLIHTKFSAHTWFGQISQLPQLKGAMVFLCEANLEDLSGQLDPFAWDWIRDVREKTKTDTVTEDLLGRVPEEHAVGAV